MKKITFFMVLLLCLGLFAYARGGTDDPSGAAGAAGLKRIEYDASSPTGGQIVPPTQEVVSFTAMFPNGSNWPGDGVWNGIIKEKLNLDITVTAFPWSGYNDKLKMLIVSDELPDVVFTNGMQNDLDNYGMNGGLVSYTEWMDILPNIRHTFLEDEEGQQTISYISASNGHIYRMAHFGTYSPLGISGASWLYREDVFKKFNIEPKFDTYEDLYQTARKLKQAAPEYYPIGTRAFRNILGSSARGWASGPIFGWNGRYYDDVSDTWKFGPLDPGFKDMVAYFAKLYDEGLMHPEILTMNSTQFLGFWAEPEKYQGIAIWAGETPTWEMSFDGNHATYPGIVVKFMKPPTSGLTGARALYQNGRVSCWSPHRGYIVSAKTANPEAILRWIDYWYSEEGKFFSSWGVEGVTFDWYNHPKYGKIPIPKGDDPSAYATENDFYTNFVQKVQYAIGFGDWGPNIYCDKFQTGPPYMTEIKGEIQARAKEYMLGPEPHVYLDSFSAEMVATKETDLNDYVSENISKLIIGEKSMDEWDEFVAGIKERDVDLILDIYNRGWKKTKETLGL